MSQTAALVLVFSILGGVFLFIGLVVWWVSRKQLERRTQTVAGIAAQIGGTPVQEMDVASHPERLPGFEMERDGLRFKVFPFMRGRYEYVEIQLVTEANLPLVVLRPERGLDRFGRAVRLNREVQLGDAELDAAVYIETDETDEHVRAALADPALRATVLRAVRAGQTITLSKHGAALVFGTSYAAPSHAQIDQAIAILRELAPHLRNVEGAAGVHRAARGDRLAVAGILGFVGVYFVSTFGRAIVPNLYEPFEDHVQRLLGRLGLGLLLFCFVGGYLYVRGHSRSLRNMLTFVIPMAFCAPVLPSIVLTALNAASESGPPSNVTGTIADKTSSGGSRSRSYRVKLRFDEQQSPPQYVTYSTFTMQVDSRTYSALKVGDRARITFHKGLLGWIYRSPGVERLPR